MYQGKVQLIVLVTTHSSRGMHNIAQAATRCNSRQAFRQVSMFTVQSALAYAWASSAACSSSK